MLRFLFWVWGLFMTTLIVRLRIIGKENVPIEGGVILASNHESWLDPQAIYQFCPRRVYPVAARWLFSIWGLNWILRAISCVPTGNASKEVLQVLNEGKAILIFPEGGCEPRGEILPVHAVHKGVAVFALKTGMPVIPIYIKGTYEILPPCRIIPKLFRTIELTFGKPIYFKRMDEEKIPDDILFSVTAKIMGEIKRIAEESS